MLARDFDVNRRAEVVVNVAYTEGHVLVELEAVQVVASLQAREENQESLDARFWPARG